MSDILIHDEYGFEQGLRRGLFLAVLEQAIATFAAAGKAVTYTEEPDGFTVYIDGVYDGRTTYAELAALEIDSEAILRGLR